MIKKIQDINNISNKIDDSFTEVYAELANGNTFRAGFLFGSLRSAVDKSIYGLEEIYSAYVTLKEHIVSSSFDSFKFKTYPTKRYSAGDYEFPFCDVQKNISIGITYEDMFDYVRFQEQKEVAELALNNGGSSSGL